MHTKKIKQQIINSYAKEYPLILKHALKWENGNEKGAGLESHGILDKQMDIIKNGNIGVRIEIVGTKNKYVQRWFTILSNRV